MRLATLTMLIALVAACGKTPPEEATLPSPLLSGDTDRLWILARASRVGDGRECKELYLTPDDPRYQGLMQKCDSWTRNYADYLRINGYPTVEHPHLQETPYWSWYKEKRSSISDCWQQVGNLKIPSTSAERAEHSRNRNACDPYDDALNNQNLLPNQLGIQYP